MQTLNTHRFTVSLPDNWKGETLAGNVFLWIKESDSIVVKIQCSQTTENTPETIQLILQQWFSGIELTDGTIIRPVEEGIEMENSLFYEYRNGEDIVVLENNIYVTYYGGVKTSTDGSIVLTFFMMIVFNENEIPNLEQEIVGMLSVIQSIDFNQQETSVPQVYLLPRLRNQKLHFIESYHSGYGGGGYNTEEIIALQANGSFSWYYSHVTSAYSGGVSLGGGHKERKERGRWETSQEGTSLTLLFDSGEAKEYTLRFEKEAVYLSGRKFWLTSL